MLARPVPLVAGLVAVSHGARGGLLLDGRVPGVGATAVYLPGTTDAAVRLPLVLLDSRRPAPLEYARQVALAAMGDRLIWNGTTPPFAAIVSRARTPRERARLLAWARSALPVDTARPRLLRIPSRTGVRLDDRLTRALQSPAARRATAAGRALAPPGFGELLSGPDGGTLWSGAIPSTVFAGRPRQSIVYLPPGLRPGRRYPLVVLLHGLRGSPYSFAGGLRLPAVADPLVTAGRVRPFIAVMPPAGRTLGFDGEWTGVWERYVLQDAIPWADAHLPVERAGATRVIAGFSAGGYGAVDIALRHPGAFGVAEAWSGYFRAPHDGSLRTATPAERTAHDPLRLLGRATGLRLLVSAGRREPVELALTRRFAAAAARDGLPVRLLVTPGRHDARQWHALLGRALRYALPAGR